MLDLNFLILILGIHSHKTANDEVADIIHLVPPEVIRNSYQFYKHIVAYNEELVSNNYNSAVSLAVD